MRASRKVLTGVLCAAIIGVGYAVAPKQLPTIEFVPPAGNAPGEVDVDGDDVTPADG